MTYATQYVFAATDMDFRNAIAGAMVKAALDINGEAQSFMTGALWRGRGKLAKEILSTPGAWLNAFAQAAIANTTSLTGSSSDSDIFNNVAAVWNDICVNMSET